MHKSFFNFPKNAPTSSADLEWGSSTVGKIKIAFWMWINLDFTVGFNGPGSKNFPKLSYGHKIVHGSVTHASVHNFSRNKVFCTYKAQRSMLLYMLRITPHGLRHKEFAGRDGHRESTSTKILDLGRRY